MAFRSGPDLVSLVLSDIGALGRLTPSRWDVLIRQARSAGLLSRIAVLAWKAGLLDAVPAGPRGHLDAALVLARAQAEETRREVAHVRQALTVTLPGLILMKGAAYLMADLPAAHGRLFGDLDILVPRELLAATEAALMLRGWAVSHPDEPYYQRYYRAWMHELPPLQHIQRMTVLDVHHAILPETARIHPDSRKLLAAAVATGCEGIFVLAPEDMVLHSACHLFYNEEFSHGLRDLSDLDLLLRHFGAEAAFWDRLGRRAEALGLTRVLYYALHHSRRRLATPVPAKLLDHATSWAPHRLLRPVMDALWQCALRPPHRSCADALTPLARFLLYLRAHWLRMPPVLLLRHLTHQALHRRKEE